MLGVHWSLKRSQHMVPVRDTAAHNAAEVHRQTARTIHVHPDQRFVLKVPAGRFQLQRPSQKVLSLSRKTKVEVLRYKHFFYCNSSFVFNSKLSQ
jgi:hypothetical protein